MYGNRLKSTHRVIGEKGSLNFLLDSLLSDYGELAKLEHGKKRQTDHKVCIVKFS